MNKYMSNPSDGFFFTNPSLTNTGLAESSIDAKPSVEYKPFHNFKWPLSKSKLYDVPLKFLTSG